jgi:hypothetical protein
MQASKNGQASVVILTDPDVGVILRDARRNRALLKMTLEFAARLKQKRAARPIRGLSPPYVAARP